MNNKKSEHSKRLLKTRQQFTQFTKSEVNKWKRIKQIKDNKRLEELQNQEIDRINKQLTELRFEYKRVASERGSAHKWAQIVAKHESDANDFEKRRNAEVLKRSKHTLNHFIDENSIKQNNIQIEKQNKILRRKQLMSSSVPQTDRNQINHILKQLNDLKQSEAVLKQVIKKKTELSNIEEPKETVAEKHILPKKLVSKNNFFDSLISTNDSKHILKQKQTNIKPFVDKQKTSFSDSKTTQVLRANTTNEESDEYLPISIATKLYHRLKTHRKEINSLANNKKIYRNVGISTTPMITTPISITPQNLSLEIENDSENIEKSSLNWSQQTSYISFPTAPNTAQNKATLALSQIYKNMNNRLNCFETKSPVDLDINSLQDLTLADDSSNSVDPLMVRINNLKELIDKKVGKTCATTASNCEPKLYITKTESIDCLDKEAEKSHKNESQNEPNQDLDAMSYNSSTSFKTLQALSSSGLSSPSFGSSLQVLDLLNKDFSSIASNRRSLSAVSNEYHSNNSSLISSVPLRDRNAFWKEIFERAGIDIDVNKIDGLFSYHPQSEPNTTTFDTFASFSLSSIGTDPNSHSTPKR